MKPGSVVDEATAPLADLPLRVLRAAAWWLFAAAVAAVTIPELLPWTVGVWALVAALGTRRISCGRARRAGA